MGHEGHEHDHDHRHGHGHHAQAPGDAPASPAREHRAAAPAHVAAFVVTCSDSRELARDETGKLIHAALEQAGHTVVGHQVIRDDGDELRQAMEAALGAGARALVVNGGTGISRRDVTIETVRPLLEKELPGFGELFRALSFQEVGSAAMLSRALAGSWRGLVVFCLPGSPNAAHLAMHRLILPELGHLVREVSR